MDTLAAAILAFVGGGGLAALILAYAGRRKTTAESTQIESDTRHTETIYYQGRVEETVRQMQTLEVEVRELKASIELAQTQYEQRVGTLHAKIDSLVTALERANTALDKANKTIDELRQEVKDGNIVISELRKEITKLLVKQAEKKE